MKTPATRLIFGCGYLGLPLAQRFLANGDEVWAVTRSQQRASEFAALGLRPLVLDLTAGLHGQASPLGRARMEQALSHLPAMETVVWAVGYDPKSGVPRQALHLQALEWVLQALGPSLGRCIYISTTGVYGDAQRAGWVNESTPCEPTTESGRVYLQAESIAQRLTSVQSAAGAGGSGNLQPTKAGEAAAPPINGPSKTVILRLAGIYGPGRLPRAQNVLQQLPVPGDPDSWLNLIHVSDAAAICQQVAMEPPCQNVYLVSDGHPVLRRDFYAELARRLNCPIPSFNPDAEQARGGGSKKVSNLQLLSDYEIRYQFPTYIEGLADAVIECSGPKRI